MEIFKLFGSIYVDNDKANKSIDETDKKGSFLGKTLGSLGPVAVAAGAAIAGAAAAAGGLAMKATEAADRINDTAPKIGISAKAFQEYDYVLSQSGAQVESLQGGMKKLVANMTDEKKEWIFNRLGVSITNAAGEYRNQEEVFEDAVRALQDMDDGAMKASLANQLFGKSGSELMPLLNAQAGSFDELKNKANELGLVMSDDAVSAGAEFADNLDTLKSALGAVGNRIGVELVPILNIMTTYIIDHMPEIQAATQTAFDVIGTVVGYAVKILGFLFDVLGAVYNIIKPYMPAIAKFTKEAMDNVVQSVGLAVEAFKEVIRWVQRAIDIVREFMKLEGATSPGGRLAEEGLRNVPGYASGTDFHPGGWAVVGEAGPELLNLPRGSEVIPNNKLGGETHNHFIIQGLTWADIESQLLAKGVRFA